MAKVKFYKLPQDLAARKDLLASDKITFAVMLDCQGQNEKSWPGIRAVVRKTGLSGQTVLSSIARLEKAGLIEAIRRGKGKSNHYKTVQEIRTLEKPNCSKNLNTGVLKIRTEPFKKLEPNQTDLLNQTGASFSFLLRSGNQWQLPPAKLSEYKTTYSHLDIPTEFRKAAQWLLDNPARRKTAKGMPKFLNGWLNRAGNGKAQPEPLTAPADEKRLAELRAEGII